MSDWLQQVNATLALLCERFPAAFVMVARRRKPLKLGIADDIVAAIGTEIDPIQLSRALRYYTHNTHYRAAQCHAGAVRIGLDGEPCGEISPEHAEQARKEVEARRNKAGAKAKAEPLKQALAKHPPEQAAPKRLGLTDLKHAARQRAGSSA